jgi:hypothetical protein
VVASILSPSPRTRSAFAAVPDVFAEAVGEADLFFQAELGALRQWDFGASDAAHRVAGAERARDPVSSQIRRLERRAAVVVSAPAAVVRAAAGHLTTVENPAAVADGLCRFVNAHDVVGGG